MSDDIKTLWQKQETEYAPMPLEEIRKRAGKFHSQVRWRNVREYVAAVIVVCGFGYYIWIFSAPLMRIGSALIIAATFYVVWQLHKRGAAGPLPAETSAATWTNYYRHELERQRDAVRGVWKWYLAPFVPGMVAFLAGSSMLLPHGGWPHVPGVAALCIAVFALVWALNALGARRLQRKIDELGG